jgi:hypothetical protein
VQQFRFCGETSVHLSNWQILGDAASEGDHFPIRNDQLSVWLGVGGKTPACCQTLRR